ncbi:hypothetical protein HanXRQr2_Chr11g0492401 [Helianthus annuus]|uniref:Uncharacterized protein n=1 Tax=Helianthus annuus TaxID=4232 RepID=A0A251TEG1_HELAN|nr:hypothetical protein HanXRQr2_Chr11g0492401 [Helianthus annuus]KAJ0875295.1 hypothetical protein HanPSC8_Chr11g0474521 [Helianthus annuus]
MAQQDDTKRTTTQTSPNGQHLQGGGSSWSPKSSSKAKQNNDHGNHHHKKSVFTKVKEKAQKLKKSMSGRKRREENGKHTPPGSASSKDDDKDHPEYFGTPSYEPQVAPHTNKQPENVTTSNDTNVDSKQSGLTLTESSSSMQDKGLSVKEYIMNKFEPGEDERALSQAITQTISPKCEKVKEAVNSLLGNEEAPELDATPSSSSTEPNDKKLINDPNLSNILQPSLSNASNISQCSTSTSASLQNRNSSNLKPNSG